MMGLLSILSLSLSSSLCVSLSMSLSSQNDRQCPQLSGDVYYVASKQCIYKFFPVFVFVFVFVCVFVFVFVLDVADTLPGSYPNRKYMVCMV